MTGSTTDEDIILGLPPESWATRASQKRPNVAYAYLRLYAYQLRFWVRDAFQIAGFLALNVLAVLGLFVVFFVMLGRGRAQGFFFHLNEVASRFLEATPTRQADFLNILMVVVLALFILVSALRGNALRARLGRSV